MEPAVGDSSPDWRKYGAETFVPAGWTLPWAVPNAMMQRETPVITRLRVGFAVQAIVQPAWVARAIELVAQLPWVDLCTILVTGRPVPSPPTPGLARPLFDSFSARELLRLPTEYGDPYEPVDLSRARSIPVTTIRTLGTMSLPGDALVAMTVHDCAALDLDVLVGSTPGSIPREVLALPRFGTWAFEAALDRSRVSLEAFWRVMTRSPQMNVELYRLHHDGTIAGTIVSAPCRNILGSPLVTEVRTRWKLPSLLVQALTHLRVHGSVPGTASAPPRPEEAPSDLVMAWLWSRHALRLVRLRLLADVVRPQWFMHYHFHETSKTDEPALAFRQFRALDTPPDRVWADPFPICRDGRYYVFFEEKLDSQPFGHISVVELTAAGPAGAPRTVLERPQHLSYPFIFDWMGTTYMMPESHDAGRLELYRAKQFPDHWELATVLRHEPLADATLAEIEGTWWMFAARQAAPHLDCDELVLYHASIPLGPWTPHAMNPVLSDVRTARPAGRVFRTPEGWIRPVQNGARGYGQAMRLMRIVTLTPTDFAEELVRELPPDWKRGLHGTHTLNAAHGLTTIDAVRFIRRRRRHDVPSGAMPRPLTLPVA